MKRLIMIVALCAALPAFPVGAQDVQAAGTREVQAQRPKINKKNLVIKEWNTKSGTNRPVLDHVTTYSPEGKKIDEIEYGDNRQKWRKRYEYDASGKVYRELIYDEHNRLAGYKKFEYNEFGRKKTQYNYDAKGRLILTKTYQYITEDA